MKPDAFIPTRDSLLSRLKHWDDHQSWRQFFDTYAGLIYGVAIRAGLSDVEAQDVVQETAIIVARKMPGFKYDPALGSFKSWLLLITRRRIEKQLKKRIPAAGPNGLWVRSGAHSQDATSRTATVERIADSRSFDLESSWDAEWQNCVSQAAVARVKAQVKPKQFQMFDLYVLKEWPVKEVARALNVSVALVYVNKHRIARLLKSEVARLEAIANGKPTSATSSCRLERAMRNF